jgi:hypothetical protein
MTTYTNNIAQDIETLIEQGYIVEDENPNTELLAWTLTLMVFGEWVMDMKDLLDYEGDTLTVCSMGIIRAFQDCLEHEFYDEDNARELGDGWFYKFVKNHPIFQK